IVNRSAGISGLAAVVPLPRADVGVDITLFMRLLPEANRRFGLTPEQVEELDARTKELVFLGATSVGSQAIARLVTTDVVTALLEAGDARTGALVCLAVTSVGSQPIARLVPTAVGTALLKRIGVRVAAKSAAKGGPVVGSAAAAGISYTARRLVGNRHVDDCYRVVRQAIERSGPGVDVPAGGPTGGPAN